MLVSCPLVVPTSPLMQVPVKRYEQTDITRDIAPGAEGTKTRRVLDLVEKECSLGDVVKRSVC